jgi:hypothetical protein
VTADFSGRLLPVPPGIQTAPSFAQDMQGPCWVSQVASERFRDWGESGPQAVVGGHTVWAQGKERPVSIIVSHPNRLGASEDLAGLIGMAEASDVSIWVEVDPYLLALIEVPPPLRSASSWDGAGSGLRQVGERCRRAADAFRRRVGQIPSVKPAVAQQSGRAVSLITPIPGYQVSDRLESSGTLIDTLPLWEGLIICWMGWWHTRRQIDQLAMALANVIGGRDPEPIDDDEFAGLPGDLPRRRLDTI